MVKEYIINEIKNINLIYVFSKTSIFNKTDNNFIGLTVVYADGNKTLKIDYQDPNFAKAIVRVVDRYEKEKDKRKIILLGEYTRKFLKDKSCFKIEKETDTKNDQIPYFSWENKAVCKYQKYLYGMICFIAKNIYKSDTFSITSLTGFKNNYNLNYKMAYQNKNINMIICENEDAIDFKIASINGSKDIINGTIKSKKDGIITTFEIGDYKGYIDYNLTDLEISKHIDLLYNTIYHENIKETILNEDRELIDFYLRFIGDKSNNNILKINDNTFIIYSKSEESFEELESKNTIYQSSKTYLNIYDDVVRIIKVKTNGMSVVDGFVDKQLSNSIEEVNIRKFEGSIIVENNDNGNYSYQIMIDNIDFKYPFDNSKLCNIDAKTIDDIKKYINSRGI